MSRNILILLFFFFTPAAVRCQNRTTDSLLAIIRSAAPDSVKINAVNNIPFDTYPPDSTLFYANTSADAARHDVSSTGGQYSLPFGAKVRLKASVDISTYPAHVQVILSAMKKYGLILADIGSDMYVSGAPDNRWNNDDLSSLGKIKASDFEVIMFE
jgi:hypothetical protein